MKDKIQSAIAHMKTKVERDSKHIYRDSITGEMYAGVSSVSSIVPKDWLAAWGAKEAVKALGYTDYPDTKVAEEVLLKIKGSTLNQYLAILKDAKGASSRKSKKALVDGTRGHKWLEDFVQARTNGQALSVIAGDPLERPIKQFLEWESANVDYWYRLMQ